MIITVTGRSGCGKSTLALMLSVKLNLPLIDVDEIVEGMYSDPNMQNTLKTSFGDVVEGPDGKVEKRLVSKIVLNNKQHWDKQDSNGKRRQEYVSIWQKGFCAVVSNYLFGITQHSRSYCRADNSGD